MREFLETIIREAGRISLESYGRIDPAAIHFKTEKDLVTDTDRAVELYITDEIKKKYPNHALYGEETGMSGKAETTGYRWIIDPIDGTTSFVHEIPFYSVSIALEYRQELVLGAVYAPKLNELFIAEKNKGAFCNGKTIRVSGRQKLAQSLIGTGFACLRSDTDKNNLPYFNRVAPRVRGVRRMGSAALDLAYTACGRLDAFWEWHLKPYDYAAGILLVREAGGVVTDLSGTHEYETRGIYAANPHVYRELFNILQDP